MDQIVCAECAEGQAGCECPDDSLAYGFHIETVDEDGYVEQEVTD